jgi:hypothetical protein
VQREVEALWSLEMWLEDWIMEISREGRPTRDGVFDHRWRPEGVTWPPL